MHTDHGQEPFSGLLLRHRGRTGLTQRQLATRIGVNMRSVQGWETGVMYPTATRLQALIAALLETGGLSAGRETDEAEALWAAVEREAPRTHPPFEQRWFEALLAARGAAGATGAAPAPSVAASPTPSDDRPESSAELQRDWGDAPAVVDFVGRAEELATVQHWVLEERSRLVGIMGMGGIGKTSVAAKAAQDVADAFQRAYWRGLRNAPPVSEWLTGAIGFLSGQQLVPPDGEANQLAALLLLLRDQPCLLVLDNFETLLEPGQREARYRDGLAGWGPVLRAVGETRHSSCVILTSREAPPDWATLGGGAVRTLEVGGLGMPESQVMLAHKQLRGDDDEWANLINRYGGNSLALKVVGESIRQVFGGQIGAFLAESESDSVFGGIRRLLAEQFERSSPLEQNVLRLLAAEREPITLAELMADLGQRSGRGALVESIEALRRRSLVERAETAGAAAFTLQPVVLEYVTDRLVDTVCEEIGSGRPRQLVEQPLIKAQAKDYVRHSQKRLIGEPILQRLRTQPGGEQVQQLLTALLEGWRGRSQVEQGYGPGNVVNLLRLERGNLRGVDLGKLALRQADLAGISAQDASLAEANLTGAVLTEAMNSPISLTLSRDGESVVAGTSAGEIWLWRVADRTPLLALRAHVGPVHAVALAGDGPLLASGSEDGTVQVWGVPDGRRISTLEGHTSPVYGVAISETGEILASGSFDGTIRLWDPISGQHLMTLDGHASGVWSVSLTPNGQLLASGSFDGAIRLWELPGGKLIATLDGLASPVWSVALSSDGRRLATGTEDGLVRLWDVAHQRLLLTLQGHTGAVRALSLTADGGLLASSSWDHTVRLWETSEGRPIATLEGHDGPVRGVALSADGRMLASSSLDDSVRLWEAPTGRPLATLKGYGSPVYGVAVSADGGVLAAGNWDGSVKLWDGRTGQALGTLFGHTSPVYGVAVTADGRVLASGSWDRTIRLWDVPARQPLAMLSGHSGGVRSVALTPDGAVVASGSWDTTVRLWQVRDSRLMVTLRGHTDGVRCVAFSADGRMLVTSGLDGTVRLWSVPDGQELGTLREGQPNPVYGVALSADGRVLASGSWDGVVRVWDPGAGALRATLRGHSGEVRSVALSGDGTRLASAGFDGTVRVWSVADGRELTLLSGHTSPVYGVAMSEDGERLVSSSSDGTVRVWDARTGAPLLTLRGDRPYERMDITGLTGVTPAQYAALMTLGAFDRR
jgi:WD40 repeat protein/transcriptional regulator with XRE-family HTH domain